MAPQQSLEGIECLWEQVYFCLFEFIFGDEIMILKEVKESKGVHCLWLGSMPFLLLCRPRIIAYFWTEIHHLIFWNREHWIGEKIIIWLSLHCITCINYVIWVSITLGNKGYVTMSEIRYFYHSNNNLLQFTDGCFRRVTMRQIYKVTQQFLL